MRLLLQQEDTDGNFQISITDRGPKVLPLGTEASNGYQSYDVCVIVPAITYARCADALREFLSTASSDNQIRGTYMLSNLLQELALAREHGRKHIILDEARLSENPVDRLSRMM